MIPLVRCGVWERPRGRRLYSLSRCADHSPGGRFALARAELNCALGEVARTLDLTTFEEDELRTAEAGQAASKVAIVPAVRAALLDLQRAFAHQPGGAVLDGRDIGTVVCPEADVKLWVDATVEVRARRRWKELTTKGAQQVGLQHTYTIFAN